MLAKLTRIFGIIGGLLTLLPYLLFLAQCVYTLTLPDSETHFESKGYASAFMVIYLVPTLIAATGFAGSFLVRKKHTLVGVLMLVAGLLTIGIPSTGYAMMFGAQAISLMSNPFIVLVQKLPQLLLIAAGVLALLYRPVVAPPKTQEVPPSENAE